MEQQGSSVEGVFYRHQEGGAKNRSPRTGPRVRAPVYPKLTASVTLGQILPDYTSLHRWLEHSTPSISPTPHVSALPRLPSILSSVRDSFTMSQAEEHPINQSGWMTVYGEPSSKPGSITVDELTNWYSTKTPGKDFVVVDVRRADCEVSNHTLTPSNPFVMTSH